MSPMKKGAMKEKTRRKLRVNELRDRIAALQAELEHTMSERRTRLLQEMDGNAILARRREEHADGLRALFAACGEDPNREGLLNTPLRCWRAMREMTTGYEQDAEHILRSAMFDEKCDEMVVVRGIRFTSLCEHHLLPFVGTVDVAYLPIAKIVGLSKIPRVVNVFARRLQVQERMTSQIAEVIDKALAPAGVGVIAKAHHSCMGCRGVNQPDAEMVTSAMLGAFRDKPEARAEFLRLCDR